MGPARRLLYESSNGDRWLLVREGASGRVYVEHRGNLPSGGQSSELELSAFLGTSGLGPEKQELLRLIGTLVEVGDETADGAAA
jgi:hypothetical protein